MMENKGSDQDLVSLRIQETVEVNTAMLRDAVLQDNVKKAVDMIVTCFREGGKLLLCGNGGSAADAEHMAAELSGRFNKHRPALYAEALHWNAAEITAISNDYGYAQVFARQIEAKGKKGDLLLAISTSGDSENVVCALEKARSQELKTVLLTGNKNRIANSCADLVLKVPSEVTARIQEGHLLLGHIICEIVEEQMFSQSEG